MRKSRLFFIALLCLSLFGLGGQAWAQDRPQYIKCEWDGTKVVSKTTNTPMDCHTHNGFEQWRNRDDRKR